MARALHRRRLIGQRMPALYANVKKAQATRLASEKSEPFINRACLCRVAREKDMTKLSEKSQELAAAGLGVSMKQRAAVSRIRRDLDWKAASPPPANSANSRCGLRQSYSVNARHVPERLGNRRQQSVPVAISTDLISLGNYGESVGVRTRDLLIKSQLLYRLSYALTLRGAKHPGRKCAEHMQVTYRGQLKKSSYLCILAHFLRACDVAQNRLPKQSTRSDQASG